MFGRSKGQFSPGETRHASVLRFKQSLQTALRMVLEERQWQISPGKEAAGDYKQQKHTQTSACYWKSIFSISWVLFLFLDHVMQPLLSGQSCDIFYHFYLLRSLLLHRRQGI